MDSYIFQPKVYDMSAFMAQWPEMYNCKKWYICINGTALSTWYVDHEMYVSRGAFKNVFELLKFIALKFSTLYKQHIFPFMGMIFYVAISKVPFEISRKVS